MACYICYDLDVETYMFETTGCSKVTRAAQLVQVKQIRISAASGCRGCSLLDQGLSLLAVKNDERIHVLFHSGLPLRIEGSDIDLELFNNQSSLPLTPCIGVGHKVSLHLDAILVAAFA